MTARSATSSTPDFAVNVVTKGMTPAVAEYARDKIGRLGRYAHRPVLHARVRMTAHCDSAAQKRLVAQANIDIDGLLVRAQVHADSEREVIDLLEARLRRRLERVAERWDVRRGNRTAAASHEWRHDSEPTHRPNRYPRPADERRVVRRKSFSMDVSTVDDAIVEMELLDYDFHLFTEKGTGAASVVYRGGPSGYRLALLAPSVIGQLSPFENPVVINPQPAPCLTGQEAIDRLNLLDLPFLFFIDAAEGRACVLYHRYDGHYGLITPSDQALRSLRRKGHEKAERT